MAPNSPRPGAGVPKYGTGTGGGVVHVHTWIISSQSPAAGTQVQKGSTITATYSDSGDLSLEDAFRTETLPAAVKDMTVGEVTKILTDNPDLGKAIGSGKDLSDPGTKKAWTDALKSSGKNLSDADAGALFNHVKANYS